MVNLIDIIFEANSREMSGDDMKEMMGAVKTSIPKAIAMVRQSLLDEEEFELYEFLQFCEWWEVRGKNLPNWMWSYTAGVRAVNEKIEFLYDKDFIETIGSKPGQLMFLIAHEASHIFRLHQDRSNAKDKKEHELWNTATDMVINRDILQTPKIGSWKPEDITIDSLMRDPKTQKAYAESSGKPWDELKKETIGLRMPKKYIDDAEKNKEKDPSPYISEKVYNHLLKNKPEEEEEEEEDRDKDPGTKDYYGVGTIVKVNSGEHKGEYRKITKNNGDGTFKTELVDINKEIDKVKNSAGVH